MQGRANSDCDRFPAGCLITEGMSASAQRSIVYANDYFYQRLGHEPGALIGQPLSALFTPASCILFDSFMLPMLLHEGRCEEILLEIKTSGGARIPVVANAIAHDSDADVIHWSLFIASQRDKLNDELLEARKLADEASQAKSDFLSSMSHELRTPMNAILGYAQLLQQDPSLPGRNHKQLNSIVQAGHHLLDLINELLDLARIEAGKLDLSLEPVELDSAVNSTLAMIRPLAEQRNIRCLYQPGSGEALAALADERRLDQILLNLFSNAVKYNREGGSLTVGTALSSADRVRLSVTDTGKGIPADRLDELFVSFNRLGAQSSDIEGTGIGLTITQRLVQAMNGSIGVDSEVDVGTTFWIELPRAAISEQCQQPATPAEPETGPRSKPAADDADSALLLYIEDSEVNLELVGMFLEMVGNIKLLKAETPHKGIELARQYRPALILLDIQMPGMDGYQVLEVLRSDAETADIPVIAVTAHALDSDRERGKSAGFSDYLTKPLDFAVFQAVIGRHLPDR